MANSDIVVCMILMRTSFSLQQLLFQEMDVASHIHHVEGSITSKGSQRLVSKSCCYFHDWRRTNFTQKLCNGNM